MKKTSYHTMSFASFSVYFQIIWTKDYLFLYYKSNAVRLRIEKKQGLNTSVFIGIIFSRNLLTVKNKGLRK